MTDHNQELVERVAVAIARADEESGYEYSDFPDNPEISDWSIHLARAAIAAAQSDGVVREIAERLIDQSDEPWPLGSDADRLHYWRDKAINAARALAALSAPEPVEEK